MCKSKISRRRFLRQSGALALGTSAMVSALANMKVYGMMNAMESGAGDGDDYRALVCFFFLGGNDSYNMLVPRSGPLYDQYAITRSNLALPSSDILPINPSNVVGSYGFHPSMPEVQSLFENGRLATINNIGMMNQPTTRESYFNDINLPLGLYSHSDQIQSWQTGSPHERSAVGWAGRMAELMQNSNPNALVPMNISLNGNSVLLGGNVLSEFVINENGAQAINGYGQTGWEYYTAQTNALNNMFDADYDHLMFKEYMKIAEDSNNANLTFQSAVENIPDFAVPFSENPISRKFEMIAKAIAARETLGLNKQIFVVEYGGWDHHDELLNNHANNLSVVSQALGEFQSAIDELGLDDCVTTFTMSEFGRTLTSNGNGTDHAWGGNMMVMGGAVNGQQMFGQYPTNLILDDDNPLNLGGGSILPTTATDEYFAELALWFGVNPEDLSAILPNVEQFYDVNSGSNPLGFLNL